jgi:hypothetical protein
LGVVLRLTFKDDRITLMEAVADAEELAAADLEIL